MRGGQWTGDEGWAEGRMNLELSDRRIGVELPLRVGVWRLEPKGAVGVV